MNKITSTAAVFTLSALPMIAGAQGSTGFQASGGVLGELMANIIAFINGALIPFILGIGFLVFVWGMFRYFIAGAADEDKRANGKNLMIYATLAFVVIIIFWGVINLIAGSFGEWAGDELEGQNIPEAPGPRPTGGVGTGGPVDA